MNKALKVFLWVAVIAPAVFVFFAIQYSAITVPFWDHCELGRLMIRIHDEGFKMSYLWAPHTHTRPLTYRAVLLFNAWLTDWDIRSEYIYMMAAIYGAFLVQALALWRLNGRIMNSRFLCGLLAVSILSFSPVGHNNHWWSMMIQLNFAHLFIVCSFVSLAAAPLRWRNQILSALACWLATYTISNGLIAFVAAALTSQFSEKQPLRLSRRSIFWIANTAAVLSVYMPGMAGTEVPHKAGPLALLWFFFVYLGSPLGGLVNFQYTSQFDLPTATLWNGLMGIVVCLGVAVVVILYRAELRSRSESARLFVAFSLFAVGSAALTAWGRAAFDAYGIANANGSRYAIFSSYLLFGVAYLLILDPAQASLPGSELSRLRFFRMGRAIALVGLSVFACNTYARSVVVYKSAHDFNKMLLSAYSSDHTDQDQYIYPNPQVVTELKTGLRRLGIGPYRGVRPPPSPLLQELARHPVEDTFHIDGLRSDPNLGEILFAHPRSRFILPVSSKTTSLTVRFGIVDGALKAKPPTSGVEFRIGLSKPGGNSDLLWSRTLEPTTVSADRGQQTITLQLHAPDGSGVVLETNAHGAFDNDWAYWAGLEIGGSR
jgi:hypothetical protein